MSKLRPSPAGLLAFVALVVALGGSAAADPVVRAARDLVTRGEIAPNAVRARHIGSRQVLGRHVRSRTLTLRTLTRGTIGALRGVAPRGIEGVIAGGDLDGTYPDPELRRGAVRTDDLANLAVTAPKLANLAVSTPKLADGAVTTPKLALNAVLSNRIADGAVALADLAVASVDSARVVDESLQAIDLGPDSVGSSEVVNESLTQADLAANSVNSGEIGDNTVTAEDLASSSVGAGELQPFSVTPQKLTGFPAARVSRTTAQAITPNVLQPIAFNTVRLEKGNFFIHDSSEPARLTAPTFGTYLIVASVHWASRDNGRRELALLHRGTTAIAADTEAASTTVQDPFQTVTAIAHLAEGDWVEAWAQQTSTQNSNLNIESSSGAQTSPEFSLVYLGP